MDEDYTQCCFAPSEDTNANRGSTVKQSDADPFQEKMRKLMEARVGKTPDSMSGMKCDSKFPSIDRIT